MRETIPDAVLGRADEVVIIDLTPEALLERLRAGKVYPSERIERGAQQLLPDREPRRRCARWRCGRSPRRSGTSACPPPTPSAAATRPIAAEASQAVGERLLALVEPYPGSQRLVRRAWRSAQRLGAELDLLWIRAPGRALTDDQERSLAALRQLASVLGARLLIEESDDVPSAIADVARRRGSTYILMGRSRPAPRSLARLRTPLPQRLMELLPGVDIRIVADRAQRQIEGR